MRCNYTLTVNLDNPAVDTFDNFYVGATLHAANIVFSDTVAINSFFQNLIDTAQLDASSVTYSLVGNVATITLNSAQAVADGYYAEWTAASNPEGTNFARSGCQTCDYSFEYRPADIGVEKLYELWDNASSGVIVNLQFDDVAGIQAALNGWVGIGGGVANYEWDNITGTGFITIIGGNVPLGHVAVGDGVTDIGDFDFIESNCQAAVAPCAPVVLCEDANLSILSWLNRVIGKNADDVYGISIVVENGSDPETPCDERETWESILKSALRQDGDCIKLAITSLQQGDFTTYDCDEFVSPDSIAKRLRMVDGDHCVSIRAIEIGGGDALDCENGLPVFSMFKATLFADGELLAIGFRSDSFDSCERTCDEARTELLLRTVFFQSGNNYLIRFLS